MLFFMSAEWRQGREGDFLEILGLLACQSKIGTLKHSEILKWWCWKSCQNIVWFQVCLSNKGRPANNAYLIFSFSNCTVQMKVFDRLHIITTSETDNFESRVLGGAYFKNRKWKGQFHAIKKQMCLNPITLNKPWMCPIRGQIFTIFVLKSVKSSVTVKRIK